MSTSDQVQSRLFGELDLKTAKTIRIAVSGDVPLTKLEWAIVDTAEFQRLRRIKQLGTTNLVYPTAVHTRFDHSLGTLGMALIMVRAIRENRHNVDDEGSISDEQEVLIRLFALLHDIAHIPFGHTLEDEFSLLPRHDEDEERTEYFLGTDSRIGQLLSRALGTALFDRFLSIYKANKETANALGEDRFIYDLVSDTACADLLDYLRRDAYFCNVCVESDYRFLKYLCLQRQDGVRRVVIRLWKQDKPTPRPDLLSELTRLLDNRYLLSERVYFHHARIISGAMIAGAVFRAMARKELKRSDLYRLGDEELLLELVHSKDDEVRRLAHSIKDRRLWKRVFERTPQQVEWQQAQARNVAVRGLMMEGWWKSPKSRVDAEDMVAGLFGMASGDVLIYCPDYHMSMKLAEMTVLWNGRLRPLRDCTDDAVVGQKLNAILESHRRLWTIGCFLNPAYMEKREQVEAACEYFFAVNGHDTEARRFYRMAVEEVSKEYASNGDLSHKDFDRKTRIAVDRLMTATAQDRSPRVIRKIVDDVFKAPD